MEMIDNFNAYNWPFRWFGLWKEYGDRYRNYPSVRQFVDESINATYSEKSKMGIYLNESYSIAFTSKMNFLSPFTGKMSFGSIGCRTDGKWYWLDNIFEFVENHNLILPVKFYEHMKENDFKIQDVRPEQIADLERPGLTIN